VSAPGPDGQVVLTFDNLGEASELERGTWPRDEPLGHHPSVHIALPRLLAALDDHHLRATFFVEAINCELYPDAVCEIARRGHEIGLHGWSHESWGQLPAERERAALDHALAAFGQLGLRPQAFRPPGGELTADTPHLLHERGLRWCSPQGERPWVNDGLAFIPFSWELVDAFHLMESFGELRGSEPLPAPEVQAIFCQRLTRARQEGVTTLVLHPFLMLDEGWWEGTQGVLGQLASLAREGRVAVGPGARLAERLLGGGRAAAGR
jgi:peptidoglycan/xylan/chitin deacetylase (PgdA/CDA1 family)